VFEDTARPPHSSTGGIHVFDIALFAGVIFGTFSNIERCYPQKLPSDRLAYSNRWLILTWFPASIHIPSGRPTVLTMTAPGDLHNSTLLVLRGLIADNPMWGFSEYWSYFGIRGPGGPGNFGSFPICLEDVFVNYKIVIKSQTKITALTCPGPPGPQEMANLNPNSEYSPITKWSVLRFLNSSLFANPSAEGRTRPWESFS